MFQIQPTDSLPIYCRNSYLLTVEQILETLLTEWLTLSREMPKESPSLFAQIQKQLPIVHIAPLDETATSIPITFLCPAEFTHGAGRYIADTLSRWLIPGEQLPLMGQIALDFHFTLYPKAKFYIIQQIISVNTKEELLTVHKNFPHLMNEMKIDIMAVYHARYITSLRSDSHKQKKLLLQETLDSLLKHSELSPYDQLQIWMTKLSSEEKSHRAKQKLTPTLQMRLKAFDRDIFYEIRQHINIFTQDFLSKRSQRQVIRIIAYQYFFKKVLQEKIQNAPLERHLSIKVTSCYLKEKHPIASILIGMNFLRATEKFEYRHLQEAIKSCLPSISFVEDSFLIDRRHETLLFLYIEIYKSDLHRLKNSSINEGDSPLRNGVASSFPQSTDSSAYSAVNGRDCASSRPFTTNEIKHLRDKLPAQLCLHIETVAHSVFMPRNEEELLRNIIILSNQIKYVRDLPQLSIHYEKQTDTHLFFTIILVRIKTTLTPPLHNLFETLQESVKINIDEIRIAGHLKKKYPKEAAILHASIEKASFFRSDYSLDLLKARQKILSDLTLALGEFRDFNGGMILQQDQAFSRLRQSIQNLPPSSELLLENYFYSIRPAMMQTVYSSSVLKAHFEMLREITEMQFTDVPYCIHQKQVESFHLYWIQATAPSFKEEILSAIGVPSNQFTHSFLQIDHGSMLGLIFRLNEEMTTQKLQEIMETTLQRVS
jgi:hypothetical protein